jgi:hypothetical protein
MVVKAMAARSIAEMKSIRLTFPGFKVDQGKNMGEAILSFPFPSQDFSSNLEAGGLKLKAGPKIP